MDLELLPACEADAMRVIGVLYEFEVPHSTGDFTSYMSRPRHYVPCISRNLVCALYHEARHRRKPMTRLVDELLTAALRGTAGWQLAQVQAQTTPAVQQHPKHHGSASMR